MSTHTLDTFFNDLASAEIPEEEQATIIQYSDTNAMLVVGEGSSSLVEEAVTAAGPMLARLKRLSGSA